MVKVREEQPLGQDGNVDIERWIEGLESRHAQFCKDRIRKACDLSLQGEEKAIATNSIWAKGHSSFRIGLDMADILLELQVDEDGIIAGLIYRAVRENQLTLNHIRKEFGNVVGDLVDGVLRMAMISDLHLNSQEPVLGQDQNQRDQARRLIVSLVSDVRVALIKLAERTSVIRSRIKAGSPRKEKLAHEILEIYAPLAHRLGIGYLKWELEDLAFRILEPQWYARIAKMLATKLSERQDYVDRVVSLIDQKLSESGIEAELEGRAKHIYSIWNKMREKGIPFSRVYDVHAVRILVSSVEACYSVLGIVHSLWRNIPHEFDDYIAAPKENGYRSLHTAVIGPEGQLLEIQIRTHEMHIEAELGVCSHWTYKSDKAGTQPEDYEERLEWLRQIIDWQEEDSDFFEVARDLLDEVNLDRIYVYTPDGHVIDLIPGATPIDFAYRVHTEVGHKCRGAKVNGKVVPLDRSLKTGDQVDIITGDEAIPRREWLYEHLGYMVTSRARSKAQAWFGRQEREKNITDGMRVLKAEMDHLSLAEIDFSVLSKKSGFRSPDDMFSVLGSGEISVNTLMDAVAETANLGMPGNQPDSFEAKEENSENMFILGAQGMETGISECCTPVPGEEITGIVLEDALVEIHRQDCIELLRKNSQDRYIKVRWSSKEAITFPVGVEVTAYDRPGLLFDITDVLTKENTNVDAINTTKDKANNRVLISLEIEVVSLKGLVFILDKIEKISNVINAKRKLVT